MDIRCRKTTCFYNNKYTCTAKEILVGNNMICTTYKKTNKNEPDTSKTMFERAPQYAPQRDSKTIDIGCKANCIFNKEGKCISNGITVNAIAEKPYCMTFVTKA